MVLVSIVIELNLQIVVRSCLSLRCKLLFLFLLLSLLTLYLLLFDPLLILFFLSLERLLLVVENHCHLQLPADLLVLAALLLVALQDE